MDTSASWLTSYKFTNHKKKTISFQTVQAKVPWLKVWAVPQVFHGLCLLIRVSTQPPVSREDFLTTLSKIAPYLSHSSHLYSTLSLRDIILLFNLCI